MLATVCKAVFNGDKLLGVVGVDVKLKELFGDSLDFDEQDTYSFIIDRYGSVLAHPLLPHTDTSSEFVTFHIRMLEVGSKLYNKVLRYMLVGRDGDVNLLAPSVAGKLTHKEGNTLTVKNLTYHFRQVGR